MLFHKILKNYLFKIKCKLSERQKEKQNGKEHGKSHADYLRQNVSEKDHIHKCPEGRA